MMKMNLPPDWSEEIGLSSATTFKGEVNRYVIILVYTVFTYNIFRNLTSCCFCHSCRRKRSWETLSRRKTFQNNMIEPPKKAIFQIKIILFADQESFETPLINYLVEKLPKRLWWGEGLNLVLMLNESVSWTIFMLLRMNPAPDWSKEWDGLLFRKQN